MTILLRGLCWILPMIALGGCASLGGGGDGGDGGDGVLGTLVVLSGPRNYDEVVIGGRVELLPGRTPNLRVSTSASDEPAILPENEPIADDERRFAFVLGGCAEKDVVLSLEDGALEPRFTDNGGIDCVQESFYVVVFDVPESDLPEGFTFRENGLGRRVLQLSANPDGAVRSQAVELDSHETVATLSNRFVGPQASLPPLAEDERRFAFVTGGCQENGAFMDGQLRPFFQVQNNPVACESQAAYLTVFDVPTTYLAEETSIG